MVLPEANTRYFRSYRWGFWGSVVLNYIIPNPIIEKALIIGSEESEAAYKNIIEALNSQDTDRFISVLNYYHSPLILYDQNADDNRLGRTFSYPYDWNLYRNLVTNNRELKKIWGKGSLSLYEVPLKVAANSHPKMNSDPLVTTEPWYFSSTADLSLLSLPPETISTSPDDIRITSSLRNKTTHKYSYQLDKKMIESLPTVWSFDGSILNIAPAAPSVEINESSAAIDDISYSSLEGSAYVSVQKRVVTPVQSTIVNLPITQLPEQIQLWQNSPKVIHLLAKTPKSAINCKDSSQVVETTYTGKVISFPTSTSESTCLSLNYTFPKSSIVTFQAKISSSQSTIPGSLCLHSMKLDKCVNEFRGFYVSPTAQEISVTLPVVLEEKDDLVAFFTFESSNVQNSVNIESPEFKYYDQVKNIPIPSITYSNTKKDIEAPPNSKITITYPTINTESVGVNLKQKYGLLPTIFHGVCAKRGREEYIKSHFDNVLSFSSTECFDGIYNDLQSNNSQKYIIAAQSENDQGIPLEVSFRRKSQNQKLFTDFIPTTGPLVKILPVALTSDSYVAEVMSRGIGPQASNNLLTDYVTFPVPPAWFDLKLTSMETQKNYPVERMSLLQKQDFGLYVGNVSPEDRLYILPTAVSPEWKAVVTNTKPTNIIQAYWLAMITSRKPQATYVNGWQQGWIIDENLPNARYILAIYFPNVLAYFGLLIGLLTGLLLLVRIKRHSPAHGST